MADVSRSEQTETKYPDMESIRRAVDVAWRDHQHTRDQTWKALHIEFAVAAGLVGVNWQIQSVHATVLAGILVLVAVLCGVQITMHHRNKVEILKFRHILNCEEALGLHRPNLICDVEMPDKISFWDVFDPRKGNTALFILRMHVAIALFAFLFIIWAIIRQVA